MPRREMIVLALVQDCGDRGVQADELGHAIGLTVQRVKVFLSRLDERGLVEKVPRRDRYRVTSAGKEYAKHEADLAEEDLRLLKAIRRERDASQHRPT
jgi:predicted transcriptional regulator